MREMKRTMSNLLLLFANDANDITQDLMRRLRGVPTYAINIENEIISSHRVLQNPAKSRLQIVFFSPGFLKFLEFRTGEAYGAFRYLDPMSTIAIFCCGLLEQEVMCYHKVPLTSFNSWPKFEVAITDDGGLFPQNLCQTIQEIFPSENLTSNDIVIVPELISKNCRTVYIIFSSALQDMTGFNVYLEGENSIQITPENVNPYVIQFRVPEVLVDSCQTISLKLRQSNSREDIIEKTLHVVDDCATPTTTVQLLPLKTPKTSREELMLNSELQFLSDFACDSFEIGTSPAEFKTLPQDDDYDDMTRSLRALCTKYGLEELSIFIDDSEKDAKDQELLSNHDFEEQTLGPDELIEIERSYAEDTNFCEDDTIGIFDEEIDAVSFKRSLSLPSLLPSPDDLNSTYGDYLHMGAFDRTKPLRFFPSPEVGLDDENVTVTSNGYVTMQWSHRSRNVFGMNTDLSNSQQELLNLMLAFKHGEKTISDVEDRFESWHRRHPEPDSHLNRSRKSLTSFLPEWRSLIKKKTNKKASKVIDSKKRISASEKTGNTRKKSSTSASSDSSIGKETSSSTISRYANVPGKKTERELYENYKFMLPSNPTECPFSPEIEPPPIPPRPLQQVKIQRGNNKVYRKEPPPRKKSAPLPPIPTDENYEKYCDRNKPQSDRLEDHRLRLNTLAQFCDKYGLEDLGDYFFNNVCPSPLKLPEQNLEVIKDESFSEIQKSTVAPNYSQMPPKEWDDVDTHIDDVVNEHSHVVLRRSLSLPSTLHPSETTKTADENDHDDTVEDSPHVLNMKEYDNSAKAPCEDCFLNSISSHVYTSLRAQAEKAQNPSLVKTALSNSQQELLELIHAFKRGHKTITQVEQQFQEWHQRHQEKSSHRDRELLKLKIEYEKAQKQTTFGLPDIKNFILGKPRKKLSKGSSTADSKIYVKQRTGKSESDSRRHSKISSTSTSSGVSDSSEVLRTVCFFNPDYGHVSQAKLHGFSTSSKPSCSSPEDIPPPLPIRPPPNPVVCHPEPVQKKSSASQVKKSKTVNEVILEPKSPKPTPPPKPPNLLEKVNFCVNMDNDKDGNSKKNEEQEDDSQTLPDSPDYITPNKPFFPVHSCNRCYPQRVKRYQQNYLAPPKFPVPPLQTTHGCRANEIRLPVSSSASPPESKKHGAYSPKVNNSDQNKTALQKRQFFKITKSKKKEESMFYVTSRKWSSFPDLKTTQLAIQPTYIELINSPDRRSKSISNSTGSQDS